MHQVRGPRLGLVTRSRTGLHSSLTYHHTCHHASHHIGPNHVHGTCYFQCDFHRGLQLDQLKNTYCLVIHNEHRALLERTTKFQLAADSYSCTVMVNFSFFFRSMLSTMTIPNFTHKAVWSFYMKGKYVNACVCMCMTFCFSWLRVYDCVGIL